jgi:hypothetical protein
MLDDQRVVIPVGALTWFLKDKKPKAIGRPYANQPTS